MGFFNSFSKRQDEIPAEVGGGVDQAFEGTDLVPFVAKERHRFAEYLLEKRLVSQVAVDAALQEQRVTGEPIGAILVRNGFMTQDVLVPTILSFNTERIATEQVDETPIDVEVLEKLGVIVSAVTEDTVFIGTMSDEESIEPIVEDAYPGKNIRFVAFLPERLPDFLDRMRRSQNFMIEGETEDVQDDEMLDRLLFSAIRQGASDVHIEPRPYSFSVFFRLLGERKLVHEGPLDVYNTMVAQLKDRSRMDLAERRIPQDGGFQIERGGRFVDVRVATIPGVEGEQAVVRILDPDRVNPRLEALGIDRLTYWQSGTSRQNGMCLICGPTGSGKTTTLNATIRGMPRFHKKIYTVEDPVEYRIPYVTQVSANPQVGLDYPRAVRAFMRGDPDIIVVGEIRDEETARNAVKAADTGHLVLGTLHTGSIVSSLSRLRDLGIDAHEMRYILRAILVQTLIRTFCKGCRGTGAGHDGEECRQCGGEGYAGRTVVSECVSFSDSSDVDRLIAMTEPGAKGDGKMPWPEMVDDAVAKMRDGFTSMEELRKVFGSLADERVHALGLDPEDFMIGRGGLL